MLTFALLSIMSYQSTAAIVRKRVQDITPGEVFDYSGFALEKRNELSLAKSLSRLAQSGEIVRLSKGKYYKPKISSFGKLKPEENQVVRLLTENRNRTVGYITGITAYNRLGLTNQVSNTLVIGRKNTQPVQEISGYRVKFVKRKMDFNQTDIKFLQLLDAMRDIKRIPDTSVDSSVKIITAHLKRLPASKVRQLMKLSFNYTAAVRALLGAIIEANFKKISTASLYSSLNPLSKYKLKVSTEVLPNKTKWRIE